MNPTIARPLAATLVFVGLAIVGALVLASAWADYAGTTAERDAKAERVSRRLSITSGALTRGERPPNLYVEAATETLAAARMDAIVRATVTEAGGAVSSTRAETKAGEGGSGDRIEIQASIEAANDSLQTILFRLENGAPMALVDALTIEPAEPTEGAVQPVVPRLHATMTLIAFWARLKT